MKELAPELFPNNENLIQQKVEAWKHGSTILASSSSYRKQVLVDNGFTNVSNILFPDSVEDLVLGDYKDLRNKKVSGGFNDPYLSEVAMAVAKEKIKYLVDDDSFKGSLLCAFDTMPMKFSFNETDITQQHDLKQTVWSADQLPKFKNKEEAKKTITEMFTSLVSADRKFNEIIDEMSKTKPVESDVVLLLERGYLARIVRVVTGFAVRLPGEEDIYSSNESANLVFDNVLKTKGNPKDIEDIVESIVSYMAEKGTLLKVSGGLDLSDEYVRQILGVREVVFPKENNISNDGVYKGLPIKAFNKFLYTLAEKRI